MSKRDQASQNQSKRSRSARGRSARSESARERPSRGGEPNRRRRRYDPDEARAAPWGRRPDGTPHTQAEFRAFLREMVRELYGVSVGGEDAGQVTANQAP